MKHHWNDEEPSCDPSDDRLLLSHVLVSPVLFNFGKSLLSLSLSTSVHFVSLQMQSLMPLADISYLLLTISSSSLIAFRASSFCSLAVSLHHKMAICSTPAFFFLFLSRSAEHVLSSGIIIINIMMILMIVRRCTFWVHLFSPVPSLTRRKHLNSERHRRTTTIWINCRSFLFSRRSSLSVSEREERATTSSTTPSSLSSFPWLKTQRWRHANEQCTMVERQWE